MKLPTHEEFDLKAKRSEAARRGAETRRLNKERKKLMPLAKKEVPAFLRQVAKALSAGEIEFYGTYYDLTCELANDDLRPQGWMVYRIDSIGMNRYKIRKVYND